VRWMSERGVEGDSLVDMCDMSLVNYLSDVP